MRSFIIVLIFSLLCAFHSLAVEPTKLKLLPTSNLVTQLVIQEACQTKYIIDNLDIFTFTSPKFKKYMKEAAKQRLKFEKMDKQIKIPTYYRPNDKLWEDYEEKKFKFLLLKRNAQRDLLFKHKLGHLVILIPIRLLESEPDYLDNYLENYKRSRD